jgi:hypothetical protein
MSKYAQPIQFFYCFTCKGYELKTNPHYAAQLKRLAERRAEINAAGKKPKKKKG